MPYTASQHFVHDMARNSRLFEPLVIGDMKLKHRVKLDSRM